MVTNEQLYLVIGVPVLLNLVFNTFIFVALSARFTQTDNRISQLETSLKDTWRAELRRVEEVLDARLKHLEERFR
jgi:hypothetical protein